jgi:hypothetical protein
MLDFERRSHEKMLFGSDSSSNRVCDLAWSEQMTI